MKNRITAALAAAVLAGGAQASDWTFLESEQFGLYTNRDVTVGRELLQQLVAYPAWYVEGFAEYLSTAVLDWGALVRLRPARPGHPRQAAHAGAQAGAGPSWAAAGAGARGIALR